MEQHATNPTSAPAMAGTYGGNGDAYAAQQQAMAASQSPYGQLRYSNQQATYLPASAHIVSAGIFGMIVAGTGAMGANLHKVQDGSMSFGDALSNSLVRGAAAGIATAAASATTSSLTRGGLFGLGVTIATATGVSYLINKE